MNKKFFVTKRFYFFILSALFLSAFLFANLVSGSNNDIVISEICPTGCASSGEQWIEIYNKGSEDVDLSSWRFWEAETNHTLSVSEKSLIQNFVLSPGSYAVITQNDVTFFDLHPDFSFLVLDSSWGTLNKSGEEIGIKSGSSDNEFIEKFTYKAIENN